MTREEIKNTVRALVAIYPKQFEMTQTIIDTIDIWSAVFANDPAELINSAVAVYINQPHEFAPRPGQLRDIIYRELHRDEISEVDAWNLVAKAIRNSAYNADEEFYKLPEDVREAIGDPCYLRNLALTEDMNVSVESSNFFKRYRTIKERKKNDTLMPEAVKNLLNGGTDEDSIPRLR